MSETKAPELTLVSPETEAAIAEDVSEVEETIATSNEEVFPLLSEDPKVIKDFWDAIVTRMARSVQNGDPLEQILIREDCAEAFVEGFVALQVPEIAGMEDPFFADKFDMLKSTVTILPVPMSQVEENMKTHPMLLCSIQLLSHHERVNAFLMHWKDNLRLEQMIQSTGCAMQPTYQELRLLYMLWVIEQSQAQNQSRIITPATGNVQPVVR